MPRPRYQIAEADVLVVHRWAYAKLHDTAWPPHAAASKARDEFPREQPTAQQLQQWCNRYLEAPQWTQLQAVIRAARRDERQMRTVRLSIHASALLHDLAAREQLTLSETIERYLGAVAIPLPQPSAPPPAEPTPAPQPAARTKTKKKTHAVVVPPKRRRAFITTKKGVCYLTAKIGREHFHLMRIYNYTIDAQKKRDMRRRHPDVDFDWKNLTRQLAEKREVCRRYRARRRTAHVPREREPFYGVFDPVERAVYVNDPPRRESIVEECGA
jgi:hypothetical protein